MTFRPSSRKKAGIRCRSVTAVACLAAAASCAALNWCSMNNAHSGQQGMRSRQQENSSSSSSNSSNVSDGQYLSAHSFMVGFVSLHATGPSQNGLSACLIGLVVASAAVSQRHGTASAVSNPLPPAKLLATPCTSAVQQAVITSSCRPSSALACTRQLTVAHFDGAHTMLAPGRESFL